MNIGVIIKEGIEDWQIIQQQKGTGEITLKGIWCEQEPGKFFGVFVRVVKEDTGENVILWTRAKESRQKEKHWSVTLKGIPAGGLYRIETCMKEAEDTPYEWALRGDIVHHIGVGDLFVIAGQSNSAGYGKDTVFDPPEIGVHLWRNSGHWDLASHPLNDSTDTAHIVNRESANSGHSPYLAFAKYLKRELNYPIGLVQTSLGGSPLVRWNPAEEGDLYENMVKAIRVQGGKIQGVLWYQGCSDTEDADRYGERFAQMVQELRKELQDEKLPFFTCQLNRLTSAPASEQTDKNWSVIRNAQCWAAGNLEGIYIMPTIDGTLSDAIHNSASFNVILGERLAKQALAHLYHRNFLSEAPRIEKISKNGEKQLKLAFSPVYDYLYTYEMDVKELPFVIESQGKRIEIQQYKMIGKDTIQLFLAEELPDNSVIHLYYGQNPKGRVIIDFATHYPVIGFSKIVE